MIKNIFKNFLYKKSGEPIIKIEKNDSQDSGIDDLNIHDDNNVMNNVDSSNQLNVDVIELISDDEDDSLQIFELQDDESPDVTSSSGLMAVREQSNLEGSETKIKNNMSVNNEKTLLDGHGNTIEECSNNDANSSQNSIVKVSNSILADNSQKICETFKANCQKKNINSNIISNLITESEKTDCSNATTMDNMDKRLVLVEDERTSIIQHQISNTTVSTTQKNKFYIINKSHMKGTQLGSPISKDVYPQNTKVLMYVTPKKNNRPKVSCLEDISNLDSNTSHRLLLFNPHNKVSVPINRIVSSTPVLLSEKKKSEGTPHFKVVNKKNTTQPMDQTSVNDREMISKKIDNTNDKITEVPTIILSPPTPLPGSGTIVPIENPKESLTKVNHSKTDIVHEGKEPSTTLDSSSKKGNTTSASMSSNSQTTVPEPGNLSTTSTTSTNKQNTIDSRTSTSSSQKTVPVAEKPKTSSIGVQTDSVPKNLKRKATDDISQDATTSFSNNQEAPPAKKQKTQSSEVASDVIIRLDGKSAHRIEISNELLDNGQERQVVSQFFDEISSVVIVQPPSKVQSTIKIINKSLRGTNRKSTVYDRSSEIDCERDILTDNETLNDKGKEDLRKENSNNQKTTSSNEPVNNNEKSNNQNLNSNEKSMNENLNKSQTSNQTTVNERLNVNLNPNNENSNSTNLNANVKIQRNEEPTPSTSTSPSQVPNKNVKPENNFVGSFSPSGWVQYGTRLLNRTDRICFTGEIDEKRQTAIEALGGQITNDPLDATVLVADKFRRTFKFICAICRSIPIVSTQWLNESIAKNDFVNPYEYILKDKEAENNHGFQLEESLMKAKKKQLLRDYTVLITPSVNCPSVNELKTIIKLAGGRALVRAPKYWGPKSMIISCNDDAPKVRKILEKKPQEILCPVVPAEFVMSSLLKQDLQINTQNLKVEKKS